MSGLILFAFAATHFLNHAVGLYSLETMHRVQAWRVAITRSWPGSIVLLLALLTHAGLALYKLARRRTLRMPWWETLQIAIALAIPFLLLPHIVNTRVANWVYHVNDTYLYELYRLWPDRADTQILLLLLVWTHSCFGLHYWLRLADGYRAVAPILLLLAVAIPALAIAGFVVAGRETTEIMSDPEALAGLQARSRWPNAADNAAMADLRDWVRIGFAGLLAAAAAIYFRRRRRGKEGMAGHVGDGQARAGPVSISYLDGPTVSAAADATLLETSRANGVPHASLCGGRGRCGTCRVEIETVLGALPPPDPVERAALVSIEAAENVRLACQIRPKSSMSVRVLLRPDELSLRPIEFFEVKDVAAAHVRAIESDTQVEISARNAPALNDWLRAKIGHGNTIDDLVFPGYELLGARIEYLLDRPAVALAYLRSRQPISLFILPTVQNCAVAVSDQRNGYNVLGWSNARHVYFAVSDLPRVDLERLEDLFEAMTESGLEDLQPTITGAGAS